VRKICIVTLPSDGKMTQIKRKPMKKTKLSRANPLTRFFALGLLLLIGALLRTPSAFAQTISYANPANVAPTLTSSSGSADLTISTGTISVADMIKLGATVPTGFTANTSYYVVSAADLSHIQLSLTPGGTAITATSATSGLGPGSYTGIRAAIAVAQGWQLARGVKLLGISSAECLAAQAQAEKIFGRVNVVIDAQRGEFYLATWEISAAARAEIAPLKIVTAAEIAARKLAGEICAGPAVDPVLFPSAGMLARLAAGRNDFVAGEDLSPIYLRETSFVKAPAQRRVI
jgi:tRNA threonylcarbamoyladenosine biosynthesis protein TsaB